MNDSRDPLEAMLQDSYLADMVSQTMDALRRARDQCAEVECELSYNRRLLHGRIDILRDELSRRAEGKRSTASELVARLPAILSDAPTPAGTTRGNRLVRMMAPGAATRMEEEVEDLLGMPFGDVATAGDTEIEAALTRLLDAERDVSEQRRILHQRLDAIQGEMARRYRDGEADIDSLLAND